MKRQVVARLGLGSCLLVASCLAGPCVAGAQPAASAPADGGAASGVAELEILAKDPAPGNLQAGQRVLVDDASCPAGQIKELTGGTDHRCPPSAGLLDASQCRPVTGSRRSSRCVARP